MNMIKKFFRSFTLPDILIWSGSTLAILLSFFLLKNTDYLQLSAALVGACCLILCAKGNVLGQIFSLVFSVIYAIISYFYAYYGEMITYLGMTAPMALAATIAWLRNPFQGNRAEVAVNRLRVREYIILFLVSALLSVPFYFILRALNTQNLWWSTFSVLTSSFAVLLTMRRSPHYALAYACNDVVLIVLWSLAAADDKKYLAMVVCFAVFLLNDIYSLFSWLLRRRRQISLSEKN